VLYASPDVVAVFVPVNVPFITCVVPFNTWYPYWHPDCASVFVIVIVFPEAVTVGEVGVAGGVVRVIDGKDVEKMVES